MRQAFACCLNNSREEKTAKRLLSRALRRRSIPNSPRNTARTESGKVPLRSSRDHLARRASNMRVSKPHKRSLDYASGAFPAGPGGNSPAFAKRTTPISINRASSSWLQLFLLSVNDTGKREFAWPQLQSLRKSIRFCSKEVPLREGVVPS